MGRGLTKPLLTTKSLGQDGQQVARNLTGSALFPKACRALFDQTSLSSMAKLCTRMTPRLFVGERDGLVVFTVVSVSGKPLFRTRCNAVYKLYTLPTTEYAQETMHCPLLPDLFFKCCYYAVFCSSRHRRVGGVCVRARVLFQLGAGKVSAEGRLRNGLLFSPLLLSVTMHLTHL